jgi:hypothetical protein
MRRFGLLLASGAALLGSSAVHAEKRTYINPVDVDYRYNWEQTNRGVSYRTGADPVIVRHKDAYYLFQTLADGYWRSTNLIDWTFITPSRWPFAASSPPRRFRTVTGSSSGPRCRSRAPVRFWFRPLQRRARLDFLVRSMPELPGRRGRQGPREDEAERDPAQGPGIRRAERR